MKPVTPSRSRCAWPWPCSRASTSRRWAWPCRGSGPEFGLDADAKGWLFSVNNIGMVLGAAVGGWLADRTGRRPVLLCAVAMFGLFTFWVVDREELRGAGDRALSRGTRVRRGAA